MRMEKINDSTIKVTITKDELDERGVNLLSLLGDEDKIESFLYSILDEIDVDDDFKSTGTVTFQVVPSTNGLDMYIKNKINPNMVEEMMNKENKTSNSFIRTMKDMTDIKNDHHSDEPVEKELNKFIEEPAWKLLDQYDRDSDDLYIIFRAREIFKLINKLMVKHHDLSDEDVQYLSRIQTNAIGLLNVVAKSDKDTLDQEKMGLYHLLTIERKQDNFKKQHPDAILDTDIPDADSEDYHNDSLPLFGEYDDEDDPDCLNFWIQISDFDNLLRLVVAVKDYVDVRSTLYKYNGEYMLQFSTHYAIDQEQYADYENTVLKAEEYGKRVIFEDNNLAKPTKLIIADNAVSELYKYFK
jgi:negative regulator of genetic competence, sporulation and motility